MGKASDFFERKRAEAGIRLNDAQREAAMRTAGPLLLLASPGSGKTTTLLMRIAYMIEERGVRPERIKAVTFSRAAANEMKERFGRMFPGLSAAEFSTIHSLAYEIVRMHGRRTGTEYRIIEGEAQADGDVREEAGGLPLNKKLVLRGLYKRITGHTMSDDEMDGLTAFIGYVKNKMIPPERWSSVKAEVQRAADIVREYETFKRADPSRRLIDYEDMLTVANEVLDSEPDLLAQFRGRYDYVLTDESQDTSLVQHAIVEKLAMEHRNLCVVADDDQSIYGWRGAEPGYLLRFKELYPDAVVLYMEQNYRSSKEIVEAADRFIRRNKHRYAKSMFTENGSAGPIVFRSLSDFRYQAKYLAQQMQRLERLSGTAILYRNNASSIALVNEFERAGIPFRVKDADHRFFSHWIVQDILNFMRMSYTDRRPELLEAIYSKMSGYISKHQIEVLKGIGNGESVFDNLLQFVQLQDYQVKLLQEAKETFRQLRDMPPLHAIRVIRARLGYEKAIERMCERLGFRREYLIGILNTLEDIAEGLDTLEQFAQRLKKLEAAVKGSRSRNVRASGGTASGAANMESDEETGRSTISAGGNITAAGAVTLSTFHSAKGLEFDRVYMIDLVEGVIPSADDRKRKGVMDDPAAAPMEEAARLFYVGMTRARAYLELIAYREKDGEAAEESEFMTAVRDIADPDWRGRESARRVAGGRPSGGSGVDSRRAASPGGGAGRDGSAGTAIRNGGAGRAGNAGTAIRSGGVPPASTDGAPARARGSSPGGAAPRVIVRDGKPGASKSASSAGRSDPNAYRHESELTPGAEVRHRVFGVGTIEGVGDGKVTIAFPSGPKALSLAACLERGLLGKP